MRDFNRASLSAIRSAHSSKSGSSSIVGARATSRTKSSSMEDVPMLIWIGIAPAWVACLAVV